MGNKKKIIAGILVIVLTAVIIDLALFSIQKRINVGKIAPASQGQLNAQQESGEKADQIQAQIDKLNELKVQHGTKNPTNEEIAKQLESLDALKKQSDQKNDSLSQDDAEDQTEKVGVIEDSLEINQ